MAPVTDTGSHRALLTAPLRGPGLARIEQLAEVVNEPWIEQKPLRIYDAESLARRARAEGADILVVEADAVSGPVLDLDLVAVAVTRSDPGNVDLAGASAAGIPVIHTPGRNADAVAELTVALLLAVTRRLVQADREVRAGEVFAGGSIPYQRHRAWELGGRTAGLVGLGAVGRATKWRLEGLGMRVMAYDPARPEAHHSLDEVLSGSDVVSLHAPATAGTHHLIDAKALASMRPGAVLLNTARGSLVDTEALVAALASGQLGGAGVDHVEGEILPAGHPLLGMDQVVLTPHIGGATYDTEERAALMVADDLAALLTGGSLRHCANPEVLSRRRT